MPSAAKNQPYLQTKWEKLKKARDAYKAARFYMWIGLASGFFFLGAGRGLEQLRGWLASWPSERAWLPLSVGLLHGLAFIFEHLGMGLVVAAIAIFFYEWGAQIKETIELSDRLSAAVETTKQMMEAIRLNESLRQLNRGRADERLPHVLDSLVGGVERGLEKPQYLQDAVQNCKSLILSLASLNDKSDWGSEEYITFVSNLIKKVVGQNAKAFSKLYEKEGEQHFLVPPTAAQMADEILAAQMKSLKSEGKYNVISDFLSWQPPQLDLLHEETRLAIEERDVQVRRVFNLVRGIPPGAKQIVLRHLDHAEKWKGKSERGFYDVRVLGAEGIKSLRRSGHHLQEITEAHFGLFINSAEKIRFKVTKRDLSDMALSRDPDMVDPSLGMFEDVWNAATSFPPDKRSGIEARDKIDQLLREMEDWKADRS